MSTPLAQYLILSAVLAALGIATVLTKRNAIGTLLGTQLVLAAAIINFASFEHFHSPARAAGSVFALVLIVLTPVQAVLVAALVLNFHRQSGTADIENASAAEER
jgi:NADH:ubiquinone oxidoreductase subunit K